MVRSDSKSDALLLVLPLWLLLLLALFSPAASSNSNPSDEIADLINSKRTANTLPKLYNNAGLACLALQYVHAFQSQCDEVGHEAPPASLFNTTFAAGCGVDASTIAPVTGILLACQSDYLGPSDAFTKLLLAKNESSSIINNKNHTEMGVTVGSYAGGSPYYWCAMFSDGSINTTYVFTKGKALDQHLGCFSGTGEPCSDSSITQASVKIGLLLITLVGIFLNH